MRSSYSCETTTSCSASNVNSKRGNSEVHLVEVDQREFLLGDSVVETSLLTQVNNLERFENLGEFSSCDIGVDVEDLTFGGFGERGEDGKSSSTN